MKFINVSTLLCLVALILTGAFLIGGYVPVWDIPTVDRAMEITRMNRMLFDDDVIFVFGVSYSDGLPFS
jgi:hypothetical protein